MMNKKIRVAIIGASMGMVHYQAAKNANNVEFVVVCDVREDQLKKAGQITGLEDTNLVRDYRELLPRDDIDAFFVASPDFFHREQTVDALRAGKHVLCEKPMALTMGDCIDMIKASEETGKKLMIGQIGRYAAGFKTAKYLIDQGEIGELFFCETEYAHDYAYAPGVDNWRKDHSRPREPMLGGGCHAMDLIRWIAGDPIEICAFANRMVLTDWPVNDTNISIMTFPSGAIGKVFLSIAVKRDYTMRSVFYGTQGTIICDNTSNHIAFYKARICRDNPGLVPGTLDQVIPIHYPVNNLSHNSLGEIVEFADCIINDKPVKTDGYEGAATVAACLASAESATRGGEKVKVNYYRKERK